MGSKDHIIKMRTFFRFVLCVSALNIRFLWYCLFDFRHMAHRCVALATSTSPNVHSSTVFSLSLSVCVLLLCPTFMIYQSLVDGNLLFSLPFSRFQRLSHHISVCSDGVKA